MNTVLCKTNKYFPVSTFLIITIILISNLGAENIHSHKRFPNHRKFIREKPFINEKPLEASNYNMDTTIPLVFRDRNTDHFLSTYLANSFNGYGMYIGSTNPIAFVPGKGIIATYRMIDVEQPFNSGFIGVALSNDGYEWFPKTYTLNPDMGAGRYPNAILSENGRASVIWNEITGDTECFGDATTDGSGLGGRAMYLWDESDLFDAEYAEIPGQLEPKDLMPLSGLQDGCYVDGYPRDLTLSHSFMVEHPNMPVVLAMFKEGRGDDGRYVLFRNDPNTNFSYYQGEINSSYSIMYDPGFVNASGDTLFAFGSVGSPDFHINDDGIGYMVQRGMNNLSETHDPTLPTIFFRKTENYGATWTGDNGDSGPLGDYGEKYFFLRDQLMTSLSDSLINTWEGDSVKLNYQDKIYYEGDPRPFVPTPGFFFWYEYDVRTDRSGGLHVNIPAWFYICPDTSFTDSEGIYYENGCADLDNNGVADTMHYIEGDFGGAGMIHFYFPDPIQDPNTGYASLVHDMSDTYYGDWVEDMSLLSGEFGPEQYFYPNITMSHDENSNVIWYAGFAGTKYYYSDDSTQIIPGDVDLFISRSADNGKSWSDIQNISSISETIQNRIIELTPHLSDKATDDDVYLLYQIPDLDQPQYSFPEGFEDYLNSVYVGHYSTQILKSVNYNNLHAVRFTIAQNYPNPFNPKTIIRFQLSYPGLVNMKLYDLSGRTVKELINNKWMEGTNEIVIDGASMASGIYFYNIEFDSYSESRKLILMK
tara:strand:- start:10486 stop:12765 length:2280 start_codon:yes stop_codon:yes gene_type:complete